MTGLRQRQSCAEVFLSRSPAPAALKDSAKSPALVWWREDLRLADNPALDAAARSARPIVSIYVLDRESPGIRPMGEASSWWLHHSLAALSQSLKAIGGGDVMVLRGPARDVVGKVVSALHIGEVFWNRRYIAAERAVDETVAADLQAAGVALTTFNGILVHEPDEVLPKAGGFFHVYGPYWKAVDVRGGKTRDVLPAPQRLIGASVDGSALGAVPLEQVGLLPTIAWADGLEATWRPGESHGRQALERFVEAGLGAYESGRNDLAADGSSRLSPYLRHGEISPVEVIRAVNRGAGAKPRRDVVKYLQEVTWRDFTYNLLAHAPEITTDAYAPRFKDFPWRKLPSSDLKAWQRGRTGYPIVDAGMRQLWNTGWMHNRVRMITASFLVKHLLADWKIGEEWFWDTLCDADPANNVVNWQWIAGCGPDAAPFFRIFNPVLQGEKFDPDGIYVKRFVPELAGVDKAWVHKPWEAPEAVLSRAGVALGRTYPRPIVDHAAARNRALDLFRSTRPMRTADPVD